MLISFIFGICAIILSPVIAVGFVFQLLVGAFSAGRNVAKEFAEAA